MDTVLFMVLSSITLLIWCELFFVYIARLLEPRVSRMVLSFVMAPAMAAGLFAIFSLENLVLVKYVASFLWFVAFLRPCLRGRTSWVCGSAAHLVFQFSIVQGVAIGLGALLLRIPMFHVVGDPTYRWGTFFSGMLIMVLLLAAMNRLVNIAQARLLLRDASQVRIVFAVHGVAVGLMVFESYLYRFDFNSIWATLLHTMLCLIVAAGFCLIFDMAKKSAAWKAREVDYGILLRQAYSRLDRFEQQAEVLEEMRRYRHDVKNLLHNIAVFINEGDYDHASQLLSEVAALAEASASGVKRYADNSLLDTLLYEFDKACEARDIRLEASCFGSSALPLSLVELCRIFNNLSANALEACQKVEENKRWIEWRTMVKGRWLIMQVRNSCTENVRFENGALLSTKDHLSQHGYGVGNVKEIVELHGGSTHIDIDDGKGVFSFEIGIPLNQTP